MMDRNGEDKGKRTGDAKAGGKWNTKLEHTGTGAKIMYCIGVHLKNVEGSRSPHMAILYTV